MREWDEEGTASSDTAGAEEMAEVASERVGKTEVVLSDTPTAARHAVEPCDPLAV